MKKQKTRGTLERAGMFVTPKELKQLASNLKKEHHQICKLLGIKCLSCDNRKFFVSIINRKRLSDSWKFEK